MVSTSGSQLLPQEAIRELRALLLPLTTVLTPNVPEAELLLSSTGKAATDLQNVEDLVDLAKAVQSLGPKYVLVKGGHLPFKKDGTVANNPEDRDLMVDILYGEGRVTRIETAYQNSKNTHGTGCSLACKFLFSINEHALIEGSCHRIESCQWYACCGSRQKGV
jgi:hydroxymethylpyrimidine kinase/phosphomethylpyrimidine kinase